MATRIWGTLWHREAALQRNWDRTLMATAGVYVLAYMVWVGGGWGTEYAQLLVGDLVLLPLGLGAAAMSWRAATHPALDNKTRRAWQLLTLA